MEGGILTTVFLPLSLAFIMAGMGLSLRLEDFKNIARYPRAIAVGFLLQMVLLPVLGFSVASVFQLEGALATGLFAIALCPGGVTSNMFSYLAKGNVALSISLTALVSLVTPFTIPLILTFGMAHFMGDARSIELPVLKSIITLLVITVVPVALGMTLRAKAPAFALKSEATIKIGSIAILALLIVAVALKNWDALPGFFAQVGLASLVLCLSSTILGFLIAKTVTDRYEDAVTIGIEVGIQNGTTGLFITLTLLQDQVMSIPSAVYTLVMFAIGSAFASYAGKKTLRLKSSR